MNELSLILPEILLTTFVCLVLIVDVFRSPDNSAATFWSAVISVLAVAVFLIVVGFPEGRQTAFAETYVLDALSVTLKIFLLIVVAGSFFYAREYFSNKNQERNEFFILAIFSTLGMMVLISAQSLLTVYLGLELLSLSLYAMVAMERDSVAASEAAMKYFVLGALASGMLLYGMSMLYGVSGTLNLSELAGQTIGGEKNLLFTFGLVFVLVGIAFKLGLAPFHMWVPDVYQGASLPTTLFISSAPKIAAFAMAVRVLIDGLPGLMAQWSDMLVILSVASIAIGNVIAIAQTNIKRMLAYSTISHMGFLLLGLIAITDQGYAASMFYVFVYSLASMSAFGFIILATGSGSDLNLIEDYSGLGKQKPLLGFLGMVVLFSLAGIPPFGGFWAKWFVLKELVASGHVWLATVAVVFSLVGAYYYLRVVKVIFFDEPRDADTLTSPRGLGTVVFGINTSAIICIGLFPGILMGICLAAMSIYGAP